MDTSPFRYRVLLVDDDEIICRLGGAILQSQGYEVLCASDGFQGLFALRQAPPDIIISDLQMPNMNGFEFLSVVRKRFPQIPIIAISGEFSGREVPESVLADAFFQKGHDAPGRALRKNTHLDRGSSDPSPSRATTEGCHLGSGRFEGKLHCRNLHPLFEDLSYVTAACCWNTHGSVRFLFF